MDIEMLKTIAEIVQGLLLLAGVFVYVKKGQYDDAADILQGVVTNAVASVQHTSGDPKSQGTQMKTTAVSLVKCALQEPRVKTAVKKLGVDVDDRVIGDLIERTISSGKLGIENPVRDMLKTAGTGAVLGFLNRKLNKVKV